MRELFCESKVSGHQSSVNFGMELQGCVACHALNLNLEERFEVLRAVLLKVQTVWDVMLHHRVSSSLHCKGSFCLRLQESRGTRTMNCWRKGQL